ncbi:MAG: DUF3868 domain-containing protein [Rikenellaceae bacterium]|nr:DUF3868 domain-containing protein [Rikenellaceae bacterium]
MWRYIYYILLAALLPTQLTTAGGRTKGGVEYVTVKQVDLVRRGEAVDIDMDIAYDKLVLRDNEQLVVTPLLVTGGDTVALPPVVFRGQVYEYVEWRREEFYNEFNPEEMPYDVVVFTRGERRSRHNALMGKRTPDQTREDIIRYAGTFVYPVGEGAALHLHQRLDGCGEWESAHTDYLASLAPPVAPRISFLVPVITETAPRRASLTAHINFEQDKYDVKPEIARNREELQKIYDFTGEMLSDEDIEVRRVIVRSYASPEATYDYNARLSANRARAVRDNVISRLESGSVAFETENVPEDWDSLRSWIADSDLPSKSEILNIIDNTPDPDVREQRIKEFDRSTYNMLYTNVYPNLRRTDVDVEYVLKPATLERGLVLIETDPSKMNMEDMVMVAEHHGRGTSEYERAMHVTMRYYPYEMVPNNNMAANALMNRDTHTAKQYLEKFSDHPQCLNNLGVAAYWDGDTEHARECFRRAADMGSDDARYNLENIAYLEY